MMRLKTLFALFLGAQALMGCEFRLQGELATKDAYVYLKEKNGERLQLHPNGNYPARLTYHQAPDRIEIEVATGVGQKKVEILIPKAYRDAGTLPPQIFLSRQATGQEYDLVINSRTLVTSAGQESTRKESCFSGARACNSSEKCRHQPKRGTRRVTYKTSDYREIITAELKEPGVFEAVARFVGVAERRNTRRALSQTLCR